MSNKVKVKSSYIPEDTIDINEWCAMFKVGSRVQKYESKERSNLLNSQYDFSKLFEPTGELGFLDKIKNLKLVDLW